VFVPVLDFELLTDAVCVLETVEVLELLDEPVSVNDDLILLLTTELYVTLALFVAFVVIVCVRLTFVLGVVDDEGQPDIVLDIVSLPLPEIVLVMVILRLILPDAELELEADSDFEI